MKDPLCHVHSDFHPTNLDNAINRLLANERFIDVTLSCDGHKFRCHRLVLAASSPLFEELLHDYPKDHPIVIIPIGIKWNILKSLIDFMYRGQTSVKQDELKKLVESAELLQVTGLYDPLTKFREFSTDYRSASKANNKHNETPAEKTIASPETNQEQEIQESSEIEQVNEDEHNDMAHDDQTYEEEDPSASKEVIVDYIEIEDSEDEQIADENTNTEEPNVAATTTTDANDLDTIISEEVNQETSSSLPTTDSHHKNKSDSNDEISIAEPTIEETKLIESDILQSQNVPNLITAAANGATVIDDPNIKLINLFQLNRPGQQQSGDGQSLTKVPWTYIHIPTKHYETPVESPSTQIPLKKTTPIAWAANTAKKIQKITPTPVVADSSPTSTTVPSFLKFNSRSMAISIKNLDRTQTSEKLNVLNMAHVADSEPENELNDEEEPQEDVDDDVETALTKRMKREFEVKSEIMDYDCGEIFLNHTDFPNLCSLLNKERDNKAEEAEAENIICQPNVSYIYAGDDDAAAAAADDETYGDMEEVHQQHHQKRQQRKPSKMNKKTKIENTDVEKSTSYCSSSGLLPPPPAESSRHQRLKDPPTLVPLSVMNAGLGPKHLYYSHKLTNNNKSEDKDLDKNLSVYDKRMEDSSTIEGESHSQHSVILRNPRCNQPRHYSNESLYAALMAVKYGESIYRASRMYQVPRKTLRNWMKRWDIKSQYPMPKQLKDAAKKKKLNQSQTATRTPTKKRTSARTCTVTSATATLTTSMTGGCMADVDNTYTV